MPNILVLKQNYDNLRDENIRLKEREYESSYTIENQKKRIEDLGKTLKRYERENKAMRELLSIWI